MSSTNQTGTRPEGACEAPFGRNYGPNRNDNEKTSYLMLFCALLLIRKSRMGLEDLAQLYPFRGDVQSLVQRLAKLES